MIAVQGDLCGYIQELADPEISAESKEAFDIAYENIKAFHEAQRSAPLEVETMPGVRCRRVTRPIGEPRTMQANQAVMHRPTLSNDYAAMDSFHWSV